MKHSFWRLPEMGPEVCHKKVTTTLKVEGRKYLFLTFISKAQQSNNLILFLINHPLDGVIKRESHPVLDIDFY